MRPSISKLVPVRDLPAALQIAVAIVSAAVALLVRIALDPWLGDVIPWATLFPAVLVSSLVAGAPSGILTLALCTVFGRLMFLSPRWSPWPNDSVAVISVVAFVVVASLMCALGAALRQTIQTLRRTSREALDAGVALETALAALSDDDRRKDEFLAMLAHELRNPLAPIRNAVEVMRKVASPEPRLVQIAEIIDRQLTHLARLVNDLLEVSRITRGKIVLERQLLSLSEIVEEAIESARPVIDRHEHSLSVALSPEVIRLDADRARLVQVVTNLLTNAAKFTPRGGHIMLHTVLDAKGSAAIKVRDTGIGIPAELQERVFDLFVQEESNLARSQGGLGIGLTLVKRLVELHDGTVTLESEGRGHGCEFVVKLPASFPVAMAVESQNDPSRCGSGALCILIVEDNPDAAETFRMLLALAGHDVRVAHHGIQALRLLDEYQPQIAFIDLGLPEMTGFELARRLRADARNANMTLVAVTGYARDVDREQARAAGFHHHLTKPVDYKDLLALLAGCTSSTIGSKQSAQPNVSEPRN